jgi:putative transposase
MLCSPTTPTAPAGNRALLRARRISIVIPERSDQQRHRRNRGSAGGRPVTLDADTYRDRNVIERSYNQLKQWRGLATRYDKLAVVYRGGAIVRSIFIWLTAL